MASVTKTITETIGEIQKTTSLYFASFEDFMEYERVVNGSIADPMDFGMEDKPEECDPRMGEVSKEDEGRTALTKLEVGKKYRITKELYGHEFDIGAVVVIVSGADGVGEYKAELLDGSDYWYIKPDEVEEI